MQTEATVLSELNQPLGLRTLSVPEPAPGQVLVQISHSGVCRTQLMEAFGQKGADPFLPHTMGHEDSGTVLEVGQDVTKVKLGDRVVMSWINGSGANVGSTVYQSPQGPVNSGAISTFMRHSITCENRFTPIPEEMPLREAALWAAPFSPGPASF